MVKGSKPQWQHLSCQCLWCIKHGKVVSVIQDLQPAESDCMCVPYPSNQTFTSVGLTVHLQIKSFLWLWTPSSFTVLEIQTLTYINSSVFDKWVLSVQEGEADCQLWKDLQCLKSGCRFFGLILWPSMLGIEARSVITKGQIACGGQNCSDSSLHWWPAHKCCVGYMEQYSGIRCFWAGIVWSTRQPYYFQSLLF